MTETVTLELLFALTQRVHDELRDMRNEMRRLAENQVSTARAVETSRDNTESLRRTVEAMREDMRLMIRTEIGGLFAHLETRLENRIAEQLAVRS
jgi:hypothetical protein